MKGGAKSTVLMCKDPDAYSRDWKSMKQGVVPKWWCGGECLDWELAIHGGRVYKNIWSKPKEFALRLSFDPSRSVIFTFMRASFSLCSLLHP